MEEPSEQAAEDEPRVARWIRPLFEDSTLWPLVAVMALVMGTFGASMLLLAVDRNPFAVAALLGVAFLSFEGYRADRRGLRPGVIGSAVIGLWLSSAAVLAATFALGLA